jgi:hypothetical protein
MEDEYGGECGTRGENEKFYKILTGEPEGKRPLTRL